MNTIDKSTRYETWEASECRIIVTYDDDLTRERALMLIGHLEKRFHADIDFSCTWWKFRYLTDDDIAMVARHYAASADIVIFASDAPGLFPLSIMRWIDSWTERRSKDEGVMVPLIGSPHIPESLYSTKRFYLRRVADRAGLDYLPQSMLLPDGPDVLTPIAPIDLVHPAIAQGQSDVSRTSIRSA